MQQWLASQAFMPSTAALAYSGLFNVTTPCSCAHVLDRLPLPHVMASQERVMRELVRNTPNSMSYYYQYSNVVDLKTQIGTINFDVHGTESVAYATAAGAQACVRLHTSMISLLHHTLLLTLTRCCGIFATGTAYAASSRRHQPVHTAA